MFRSSCRHDFQEWGQRIVTRITSTITSIEFPRIISEHYLSSIKNLSKTVTFISINRRKLCGIDLKVTKTSLVQWTRMMQTRLDRRFYDTISLFRLSRGNRTILKLYSTVIENEDTTL